jgi:5,6-dimethylbenzimidazole synthase
MALLANQPQPFHDQIAESLRWLLTWRRDVRSFKTDPIDRSTIIDLIAQANLAPSVGLSQPWRFILVDDLNRRGAVIASFQRENALALDDYSDARRQLYASLKLAGLREAPVHIAVFCASDTTTGHGLGRRSMPEMLNYSVVCAVHSFWLAARAQGIGVGWVSILDPTETKAALDVPPDWSLIAYLCVGLPQEMTQEPELARKGWEKRHCLDDVIVQR